MGRDYPTGVKTFGTFPDRATICRWQQKVEGADPINWAPALALGYRGGGAPVEIEETAWRLFMTLVGQGTYTWPLVSAYRDVRDIAAKRGCTWPSKPTVYRPGRASPRRSGLKHSTARTKRPEC